MRCLVRSQPCAHGEVAADLTDGAAVERAFAGATAAYVILPDDMRAERFHADRREKADNIASAVRRAGVPRVVVVSSLAAALGERAEAGFGADLAYLERRLFETSASVTVLRAPYFQDNVVAALPFAARDGVYPSLFCEPSSSVETVAAVDVGRVAARLLLETPRSHREIIDLAGPAYTAGEIAQHLEALVRRPVAVLALEGPAREAALRAWMSEEATRAMIATLDALGSGRALRRGDYRAPTTTRLEAVLASADSLVVR